MPQAGKYEYPSRDLNDCINFLSKAHDVSSALAINRENFAKAIGMSSKGGAFGLLVGSMGIYGLVETGDGNIRYSDLLQKILFGQSKEKEESKNEALRNVKLFAEIFDRYGNIPTMEQIRHILREKAGVSLSQEASLASEVGKLFKRNVQHMRVGGGEQKISGLTNQQQFSGGGLFTITAQGLTIEVDNLMKLGLVEKMVEDAKKKLTENDSNSVKGKKGTDNQNNSVAAQS